MLSLLIMFLLIRGAYYLIYRAIIKIIREIKKSNLCSEQQHPQSTVNRTLGRSILRRQPEQQRPQPAASYSQTSVNPPRTATKLPPTLSDPQLRYCMRNYEAPEVLRADEGCPNSSTPNPPSART